MDGVHDMGGMQGFGPVNPEPENEEPVFHHPWEGRMMGVDRSAVGPKGTTLDRWRHMVECISPGQYLSIAYYNKWYLATAVNYLDAGLVTISELASGKAESVPEGMPPPPAPGSAGAVMAERYDTSTPVERDPAYANGDAVRASQMSPSGHTRLPRYIRGHPGRIHDYYGWHLLPDANAVGVKRGEPLYCVAFRASDLWPGEGRENDFVYIDMWESYLERG